MQMSDARLDEYSFQCSRVLRWVDSGIEGRLIVAPDHLVGTRDEQMTIRGVVIGYTSYKTFETAVNLKQPSKRKLKEFHVFSWENIGQNTWLGRLPHSVFVRIGSGSLRLQPTAGSPLPKS
jgi:hypothetical protein